MPQKIAPPTHTAPSPAVWSSESFAHCPNGQVPQEERPASEIAGKNLTKGTNSQSELHTVRHEKWGHSTTKAWIYQFI